MNLTQTEGGARICTGGSCSQGKGKCETPDACQLPADEEEAMLRDLWTAGIVMLVALPCIAAVVHWLMN